MVTPLITPQSEPLSGSNLYTGWFLTFGVDIPVLVRELGITSDLTALGAVPRLMLIRLGEKGAFKVSPITGKVLGFELFGVRLMNNEMLSTPTPKALQAAAMTIPLKLPFHPVIFEQGTGEVECLEPAFRHIGYKIAASRTGDRFRVSLFRAGPAEHYLRIGTCITIGLDEAGALSEIWLDGVQHSSSPHLPLE
jgi:hypothetical protein